MPLLQTVTASLLQLEWVGILLARIAVGLLFLLSGYGKLFRRDAAERMFETLREARIPYPRFSAVAVSAIEFVCGGLLVIGALTRVASLMLSADMVVALATIDARHIDGSSASGWLSKFLFLPQVLYVVILVWLLFSGPGWLSVDHALLGARFV